MKSLISNISFVKSITATILVLWAPIALAQTICTVTQFSAGPAQVPDEARNPAVSGRHVYAAYTDPNGVVLQVSDDDGGTWTGNVLAASGVSPRLAAVGANVYITWISDKTLWVAVSHDWGQTFTKTALPSKNVNSSTLPNIGADGRGVVIAAINVEGVVIATSADQGYNFATKIIPIAPAREVDAISYGDSMAVCWMVTGADGYAKAMMVTSHDAGATFSQPKLLTANGRQAREPLFAVASDGTLYRVWRADGGLNAGLPAGVSSTGFVAASKDFGLTWEKAMLVDPAVTQARRFAIAVNDNGVYVSYINSLPDGWHAQIAIGDGTSFSKTIDMGVTGLTNSTNTESNQPRVWASGGRFRMTYHLQGKVWSLMTPGGIPTPIEAGESSQCAGSFVLFIGAAGEAKIAKCVRAPK